MSWDLKVLKEKVHKKHGYEIAYLEPYLSSLDKRQKFARYHFKEFNRLLSCPLKILKRDDEVYQAEAHIFALMQCMHGLIDTLAHVIYHALAMSNIEETKIPLNKIDIYTVKGKLLNSGKYLDLIRLITKLICDDNFKYLEAFVNHSKHRSLIGITFLFESVEPEFLFSKFSYKEKDYIEKPIKEYIDLEYGRQSQLVVEIGNKINESV